MDSVYRPPPDAFNNLELLKEYFSQLHYLDIDTVYFYKKFGFQLLKREYHHSLTVWYLFIRIEKIFKSVFQIFIFVSQDKMSEYIKESRDLSWNLVLLLILSFLLVKSYRIQELESHFTWWREIIRLMIIMQLLKLVLREYKDYVDIFGFFYVFIRLHFRFVERLQNCFKALPPNITYLKFESRMFDYHLSIITEKFFEIYLFSLYSAAVFPKFIFVYDYSYQTHKISAQGLAKLLETIKELPPNMILDISGNDLMSMMSIKNRDLFLLLVNSKKKQIIFHDNGESELQRVFLPLLSMIKQKKIPYEIMIQFMTYLVEPQEIRYLNEKYNQYIYEMGDLDYRLDEEDFYSYFYFLPRRNQSSCFLPPFQEKWLEDPAFNETLKKGNKNCFDNLLIEHSLFQLLKEHPLSKVASNPFEVKPMFKLDEVKTYLLNLDDKPVMEYLNSWGELINSSNLSQSDVEKIEELLEFVFINRAHFSPFIEELFKALNYIFLKIDTIFTEKELSPDEPSLMLMDYVFSTPERATRLLSWNLIQKNLVKILQDSSSKYFKKMMADAEFTDFICESIHPNTFVSINGKAIWSRAIKFSSDEVFQSLIANGADVNGRSQSSGIKLLR